MISSPGASTMDGNLPQRIKWRRSMIISPSVSRDGSSASPRRINPLGTDAGSGRIKSPSVSTLEDNLPRRINPSAGHLFPQSVPGHPRSLRVWFPQEGRRFNRLVMSNHGQTNHSGVKNWILQQRESKRVDPHPGHWRQAISFAAPHWPPHQRPPPGSDPDCSLYTPSHARASTPSHPDKKETKRTPRF